MDKKALIAVIQGAISTPSTYKGLKTAGQAYLEAVGTEREQVAAEVLIEEAKADVTTVDELIAFAGSPVGTEVFGQEAAKQLEVHGRKLKTEGVRYCDCDACKAALASSKYGHLLLE